MILAYRILSLIIYPGLIIYIYLRKIFGKEDSIRFKEKILISHFNVRRNLKNKLIWFHASSIGEFNSIIPIIEKLNKKKSKLDFLITTTTLSSGNLAKTKLKKFKNVQHRFFPLDVIFLIDAFLRLWKPDKIFLVDSEIWPNLILHAHKKGIPIALINARLTVRSFNKWIMFPKTAKKIFNSFDLCLSSNLETKKFLEKLNARNIYFKGNIKLINKVNFKNIKNINKKILSNKRFWIAASTHEEEEIFCLKTHLRIKQKYNDILTIIAPRHIERTQDIKSLSKKFNLEAQILNKGEPIMKKKEIIIINSFGVLQEYFKFSKSVFMGKSLIRKLKNDSGQNPIDAAKLKCKIYHGPFVYNFKEIYKILKKNNISKKIENYKELSANLISDLKSPIKKNNKSVSIINDLGQKTLNDTMENINNFIFNDIKKT
tara:strand:- start:241 stop:1530 length:1290 start_codon:yes stop_codon:yes gene_type:complete